MSCDWGLASLPIAGLWNSQLKLRKKVVVWVLMGMGFLFVFGSLQGHLLTVSKHWGLPTSPLAVGEEFFESRPLL